MVGVSTPDTRIDCPTPAPPGQCLSEQDFTTTTTTTPTTTPLYSDYYDIYYDDIEYIYRPQVISDPPFTSKEIMSSTAEFMSTETLSTDMKSR